jgi:flagellar biosynthesis protein FlhF
MKLKRFFASDMRQALRLVREEQGPDAVILSNQRVDGGIEIIAAVDYDPVLAQHMLAGSAAPANDRRARADEGAATAQQESAAAAPPAVEARAAASHSAATTKASQPAAAASAAPEPRVDTIAPQAHAIGDMQRELAELRRLLECQLVGLAWREPDARDPFAGTALRGLGAFDLDPDIAASIALEIGPRVERERALRELVRLLHARLPLVGEEVIDEGGVVALVGPTGVGKTTTVAKLAARFALRHGKRRLALVSLDNFRIGAHEQLLTFGRILGVPVHFTGDTEGLRRYLDRLGDKALVLVDTAGLGQRDARLTEQLAPLAAMGEDVRVLLTLAATTQRAALDEIVARFAPYQPSAIVLTKVDEAVSLGPALSALVQSGIPLAYATDGQRVPEDIHYAHSKRLALAARALQLAQPDDVDLAAPAAMDEELYCA